MLVWKPLMEMLDFLLWKEILEKTSNLVIQSMNQSLDWIYACSSGRGRLSQGCCFFLLYTGAPFIAAIKGRTAATVETGLLNASSEFDRFQQHVILNAYFFFLFFLEVLCSS